MEKLPISMEEDSVDQNQNSTIQYYGNSDEHRGSWEKEKGANTHNNFTLTKKHNTTRREVEQRPPH